jgi:hypothetical protein
MVIQGCHAMVKGCHYNGPRMPFAMVTTVAFLCAVLVTYMKRILKKVATEEVHEVFQMCSWREKKIVEAAT